MEETSSKKGEKNISREILVSNALELSATDGWENVTLAAVAKRAGVSLFDVLEYFDSTADIVKSYIRMVDRKVLDSFCKGNDDETKRDRLFDILMERFDVLNEDRQAVVSIVRFMKNNPGQGAVILPHIACSMLKMMQACGIETGGIKGAVKLAGVKALYVRTLFVWAEDESRDMAKTMATLDKGLGKGEKLLNSLAGFGKAF